MGSTPVHPATTAPVDPPSAPGRRVFRPERSPVSVSTEGEPRRSDHHVAPIPHRISAPPPADRILGFPVLRPLPYPIGDNVPDRVMPLTEPFVSAAAHALDRDPDNFELRMADFTTRGRQMFLPADQRSRRTTSTNSTSSATGSDGEGQNSSSIGNVSDLGDDSDEPEAIGGSTVLPPASTITGPVEVEAEIPRAEIPPYGGPYVLQLDLPQDYLAAGVDVRTRVCITVRLCTLSLLLPVLTSAQNIFQVTVSACGSSSNGAFNTAMNTRQRRREEERYLQYRDGQRLDDFVRWHLNAAVAFSVSSSPAIFFSCENSQLIALFIDGYTSGRRSGSSI